MPRVVVGVDGSEDSRRALRFAYEEARLRGGTLHAVHVWRIPLSLALPEPGIAGFAPVRADDLDRVAGKLERAAEELLDRELAEELGDEPEVEVRREAIEGNPAEALLAAARDADLVVVGSRGRGGFKGLLLGSVSGQVAGHAPCPVAIVPREQPTTG